MSDIFVDTIEEIKKLVQYKNNWSAYPYYEDKYFWTYVGKCGSGFDSLFFITSNNEMWLYYDLQHDPLHLKNNPNRSIQAALNIIHHFMPKYHHYFLIQTKQDSQVKIIGVDGESKQDIWCKKVLLSVCENVLKQYQKIQLIKVLAPLKGE